MPYTKEQARKHARKRREERRQAGFCVRCGKVPPEPGLINCRACLDKIAGYRERWAQQGLCNRCGKLPVRPDGPTCQECHKKQHALYLTSKRDGRHRYYRRKAEGRCTGCGEPLTQDDEYNKKPRAQCDDCRQKRRDAKAKQRNWRYPHILERDRFRCQLCRRTRRLCVHHIDGKGETLPANERNEALENLITLCQYCHYALTCLRQAPVDRELAIKLLSA